MKQFFSFSTEYYLNITLPFRTTHCFQQYKKLFKKKYNSRDTIQEIILYAIIYEIPNISKKTPLTSSPSSSKLHILWVTAWSQEHWPNGQFYALMLRTKLYQNPFFSTVHQNINKRNNCFINTLITGGSKKVTHT